MTNKTPLNKAFIKLFLMNFIGFLTLLITYTTWEIQPLITITWELGILYWLWDKEKELKNNKLNDYFME